MTLDPLRRTVSLAEGLDISRVVTGLWQIADEERKGEAVDAEALADAMAKYVDRGLTTFDMADHYGSSELIAGAYRRRHGGALQALTKWVPAPGPPDRSAAEEAVELARERLEVDAIDLLQFHAWNYWDPGWLDQLAWLTELREEGKILHLGLTNTDAAHLAMAVESGFPIVSNQVSYSLIDLRAAGTMSDVCRTHGVRLLAYGTLAGGFLTRRWLDEPEPPLDDRLTWSQMKYLRFIQAAGGWDRFQALLDVLSAESDRLRVSMANLAVRFVLEQPSVSGVIVGARLGGGSRLEETANVFDFSLDEAAHERLRAVAESLDPVHGGCGDEYRSPPFLTAAGDLSHHVSSFPDPYPTRTVHGRSQVTTGTVWEDLAGFSRAVRAGSRVLVSGTTATHGSRVIGGNDPAAQTHFVIDKIEGALRSLGADLSQVVRTRIYVRNRGDWEAVSRAHGSRFHGIWPANTLVEAAPIGEEYLVEMEAEAALE